MDKNNNPLISVIIPVYNVEKYLKRCLDSVLNQSYKNLEIILVNDGSTDKSGSICDEYSEADKRIKVIHKVNGGVAQARNTGLDYAKGEYISFVDSDDLISEEMIERLYCGITENNCDISMCGFWSCFENKNIDFSKKTKNITVNIFQDEEKLKIFGWKEQIASNCVWAKLIKTELFENLRFPAFRTAEDVFVAFKLYHKAKKIFVTDEQFYYYICRQGSLMHGKALNANDTISVCDKLMEYCDESVIGEALKEKMIALLLKIKADTILESYFYSVKIKLGKEEIKYIKELYYKIRPELKEKGVLRAQYRVFELSPFLFCVCVEIYYTLIGRNRV